MPTKLSPAEAVDVMGAWTVLEAAEFVKLAEEKFGVKAAAMGPVMAAPAAGAAGGAAAEEKTDFTVFLVSAGDKKIQVIKTVRELTGLGLKEAKDLVEAGDKPLKENVSKEEAAKVKKQIEDAGGAVEIK